MKEETLLFRDTMANAEVRYIPVPIRNGVIGAHIGWKDATSSAAIVLELSSMSGRSPVAPGSAWEWKDSGVVITGPAGSAAGSTLVNCENVRQAMARFKITAAAACIFEIYDTGEGA